MRVPAVRPCAITNVPLGTYDGLGSSAFGWVSCGLSDPPTKRLIAVAPPTASTVRRAGLIATLPGIELKISLHMKCAVIADGDQMHAHNDMHQAIDLPATSS